VRDGYDQDMVVAYDVPDVVREPLDPHPPSIKVSPNALDQVPVRGQREIELIVRSPAARKVKPRPS